MALYAYEAIDGRGQLLTGKVEAENETAAVSRLRRMGYTTVDLDEVRESRLKGVLQVRRRSVSMGDLTLFTRQLAAMLNAGIPLIRTLNALTEQTTNPRLGEITKDVARNVEGGMSFSEALRVYSEVFSDMYVDMVRAGEVGGNLVEVLERLADQIDRDKTLRDNIRSATFYPLAVMIFAVVVLLGMLFFIVPVFTAMFPPGVALPLPTRVVIGVSNSLRGYWYLYLVGAVGLGLGLRTFAASEHGERTVDQVKFRLPIFGDLFLKTTVARFCRTLSTLLAGGIPVLQALETAGPTAGSVQVATAVRDAGRSIQEGQSIAEPLRRSELFPPMVTIMIAIGEETGELASLLNRVADFYEEEVAIITKGLTSLIEPLLLILVGGLVGAMVVSLYLPMFTVITQIGG